ncbi:MAG: hypothetical protein AAFN93_05155 [Bacteroidota bacterium]
MKVYRFLILSILALTIGCNENNTVAPTDQCFEVSYVTGICGQAILKIKNPAYFELGENTGGEENVFFTTFDCSVDESQLSKANFFVKITQDTTDTDCIRCLAAVGYEGNKRYLVDVVDNCAASSSD